MKISEGIKKGVGYVAAGIFGYFVSDYHNRKNDPKYRAGFIRNMTIATVSIYGMTQFLPGCAQKMGNIIEKWNDNKFKIESLKIEKGIVDYDPKKDINERFDEYNKLLNQTKSEITDKINKSVSGLEQKIDPLYSRQDEIADNVSNALQNYSANASHNDEQHTPSDYVVFVVSKSRNIGQLIDENNTVRFQCKVSNAKHGGPANGEYSIKSIMPKHDGLGPYFIKLDGVLGLGGTGGNREMMHAIDQGIDIANNGIRLKDQDIRKLVDDYTFDSVMIID